MRGYERNKPPVAVSYRRERRPQTLKHRLLQLLETHSSIHSQRITSRARKHIQHCLTGSTRRSPQPAMPSFGTGVRRLLPQLLHPGTVYTLLTHHTYRAVRQVRHISSGETTVERRKKPESQANTFPLT